MRTRNNWPAYCTCANTNESGRDPLFFLLNVMRIPFTILLVLLFAALACNFPTTQAFSPTVGAVLDPGQFATPQGAAVAPPTLPPMRDPNQPAISPTPDAPHTQPTLATGGTQYFVP